MGAINILSKQVSELIAAGEVIERPSSVIKELVENSIDAHANAITVEIKNGGITFMRVTDNGNGIMREDVKNAFLRHATSKIAESNDLDSIATLGFRGEALASICAVSKVELMTKNINESEGTRYTLDGGEEKSFDIVGCPQGTTFIVRDLFYNVPARMKFLKKDVAESNAVSTLMDRIALSHPEIGFTFIRDGKQVMKTSGNGKLDNAVFQIFGKQFYSSLIPASYEYGGVKLNGYISKPTASNRANRSMQIFFVNGRYVRTKTAAAALEQAYKGSIMTGKFPACVIDIEVNCSSLDVNVHPAKLEIRFTNERPIYDCVYYAVKSAISEYDPRNSRENDLNFVPTDPVLLGPTADKGVQLGFSYEKPDNIKDEPQIYMPSETNYNGNLLSDSFSVGGAYFSVGGAYFKEKPPIHTVNLTDAFDYKKKTGTVPESPFMQKTEFGLSDVINIAEENRTFGSGLSSAEGTVTEKSPKQSEDEKTIKTEQDTEMESDVTCRESQSDAENNNEVVVEEAVTVDADKRQAFTRYIGEAFSTYIIIEYSDDRLMFIDKHAAHERLIYEELKRRHKQSMPQMLLEPITITLDKSECQAVLDNKELLMEAGFDVDEFGSGTLILRSVPIILENMEITEQFMEIADYLLKHKKLILSEKMEWIYQNTACRAAVKAGNTSHPRELIELALTLERNPEIKYCPHGRPVYFFMSKREIEKNFKRV